MTAKERKARERERKRAQGLALKQIWVPPSAWPIVRDLATAEAEEAVFNARTYGNEVEPGIAYLRERAGEIINVELAFAELRVGREDAPKEVGKLIRALIKVYDPDQKAHPEMVEVAKSELE